MLLIKKILFTLFLLFVFTGLAKNIELEKEKMRKLAAELRCVVCQNQSLLESDSQIAKDLKDLILEMYMSGNSESEIKLFLVDRYGEFILFKPTFSFSNIFLWFAPLFSFLVLSFIALKKLSFLKREK
ncbi:MAG: cytochrome c-type biogenesis protein CcmH [Alphaproteobacteria bacterium TMED93]|nr:MAG: cytochrome c-type biogenesis protein CcmH [Alphaproteobacteria bacterium TMED93]|tara:strand:- start:1645 stop:2028 length:384 start_codon:yes stop_codon:yes gene_type:complete